MQSKSCSQSSLLAINIEWKQFVKADAILKSTMIWEIIMLRICLIAEIDLLNIPFITSTTNLSFVTNLEWFACKKVNYPFEHVGILGFSLNSCFSPSILSRKPLASVVGYYTQNFQCNLSKVTNLNLNKI